MGFTAAQNLPPPSLAPRMDGFGLPQVVFEEPTWKETWEPMMRADFNLFDQYPGWKFGKFLDRLLIDDGGLDDAWKDQEEMDFVWAFYAEFPIWVFDCKNVYDRQSTQGVSWSQVGKTPLALSKLAWRIVAKEVFWFVSVLFGQSHALWLDEGTSSSMRELQSLISLYIAGGAKVNTLSRATWCRCGVFAVFFLTNREVVFTCLIRCVFFKAWKDWTTAEFDYQVLKDSVLGLETDKAVFFSCKSLRFFSCFFSFSNSESVKENPVSG